MAVTVDGLPARALADEPFTVVLTGLTPRSDVTIEVRLDNCLGGAWRGTFRANADAAGVLDLATVALTGFAEPDPTALLWAVEPDGEPDPAAADAEDTRGALTVLEGERQVAVREFARVFRDRGVTCTELAGPVVGALYLPAGPGPHPAVMTVSGSGGGIARAEAAMLASRGFACLALAYFNYPGLAARASRSAAGVLRPGAGLARCPAAGASGGDRGQGQFSRRGAQPAARCHLRGSAGCGGRRAQRVRLGRGQCRSV